MSVATPDAVITPALGRRAEDRFARAMEALGYDVWRYDVYSQIHHLLPEAQAQRVSAGLQASYDPTAPFWRCSPDFCVRPRTAGTGRSWLAEVKGPSPEHHNLVLEATQLLNLSLLADCLWLDIRYVYAAEGQPPRMQSVEDVVRSVEEVFVNRGHPSAHSSDLLRRQTDVRWRERANTRYFDPYVKIPAAALALWPAVPPAGAVQP